MRQMRFLVADNGRARVVEYRLPDKAWQEVACFDNPDAHLPVHEIARDRPPRVDESAAPGHHAIEPHTTPREKTAQQFARQLGDFLLKAAQENRYDKLVLVSPPRFLGVLREHLDEACKARLWDELQHDYTTLTFEELRDRLARLELKF